MWAAATASTQIESAAFEDGKGLSNWDIYPTINNVVYQNQSPNDGCDHYHHVEEDVALMAKLGLKGYRFSFAWPRIIPNGIGEVNEKGLAKKFNGSSMARNRVSLLTRTGTMELFTAVVLGIRSDMSTGMFTRLRSI